MKLVNQSLETLTKNIVRYLQNNIGYIFSIVAVKGIRTATPISVSSDFPDTWVLDDDGNVVETISDGTILRTSLTLPAIAVSIYDGANTNVGAGAVAGTTIDGKTIKGYKNNYVIQLDIWAGSPKERDVISSRIINLLFKKRHESMRELGVEEIQMISLGERGFDLTDRILQYQSHQITKVWRRLLDFQIISESYYIDESDEDSFVIEVVNIETGYITSQSGMIIGDLIEEYLKGIWENVNVEMI